LTCEAGIFIYCESAVEAAPHRQSRLPNARANR
jgi:hypothetical protein